MTDINKALEKLNETHREQLGKYAQILRVGHGALSKRDACNRLYGYITALEDSGIITNQNGLGLLDYYMNGGK